MPEDSPAIYLDWQFWSAVVAGLALILSQLPPISHLVRRRRLELEVHGRALVTHKVGNPNVTFYVSVRNTGGWPIRVRAMRVSVSRDGKPLCELPAQNYFETSSSRESVLFVPYLLDPGEQWAHGTNFLHLFDRQAEKLYRVSESALKADIRGKISMRPAEEKQPVVAEPGLVKPFLELFSQLFVWLPGEYALDLVVDTEPASASVSQRYRFTLYESDSLDLRSHTDGYKLGDGIYYSDDNHFGVLVPLAPQGS